MEYYQSIEEGKNVGIEANFDDTKEIDVKEIRKALDYNKDEDIEEIPPKYLHLNLQ